MKNESEKQKEVHVRQANGVPIVFSFPVANFQLVNIYDLRLKIADKLKAPLGVITVLDTDRENLVLKDVDRIAEILEK